MVALVKLIAQRTSNSLTTEKTELLRVLPETPESYWRKLAEILKPEDWESVENL